MENTTVTIPISLYTNLVEGSIQLDSIRKAVKSCIEEGYEGKCRLEMSTKMKALIEVIFPAEVEDGWEEFKERKAEEERRKS